MGVRVSEVRQEYERAFGEEKGSGVMEQIMRIVLKPDGAPKCRPEVYKVLSDLHSSFYFIGTDEDRARLIARALNGLPERLLDNEFKVVRPAVTDAVCSSISLIAEPDAFRYVLSLLSSISGLGTRVLHGGVVLQTPFGVSPSSELIGDGDTETVTPFLYLCANASSPCVAQGIEDKLHAFMDIDPLSATSISHPNGYSPEEFLLESARVAEQMQFESILSVFRGLKDCFRYCVADVAEEFEELEQERMAAHRFETLLS